MNRYLVVLSLLLGRASGAQLYNGTTNYNGAAYNVVNTTSSGSGTGVTGYCSSCLGVKGVSDTSSGVFGSSTTGAGVDGTGLGSGSTGVSGVGQGYGVKGTGGVAGVYGFADGTVGSVGVWASGPTGHDAMKVTSTNGRGIVLTSTTGTGLSATSTSASAIQAYNSGVGSTIYGNNTGTGDAIYGYNASGTAATGVKAVSLRGHGVYAESNALTGTPYYALLATSSSTDAVHATSGNGMGVWAQSSTSNGVQGKTAGAGASGVYGEATSGNGVAGRATGSGIAILGDTVAGYAGYFTNVVYVTATLYAAAKYFKIDHPSDPGNKFLNHASVESSEYKNFYDGTVVLDAGGRARVSLPAWMEVLNADFRYGLTPIGAPASLYVSREISDGYFEIAGGQANQKVSWSVTGIRKDPYVVQHPLVVEEVKPADKRDTYLIPALYGQPADKAFVRLP